MRLEMIQNNSVTTDIVKSHLADLIVKTFEICLNFSELPPQVVGHSYMHMRWNLVPFLIYFSAE